MKIYSFIAIVVAVLLAAPALAALSVAEEQQMLAAHNSERGIYPGVNPLQWSPELAQYAQKWAQFLADNNLWQHRDDVRSKDDDKTPKNPFRPGEYLGENLSWTSAPATGAGLAAVGSWIAEKQWYHHAVDDGFGAQNKPPGCTAPVEPERKFCGHFTQVIWKATQFVGCGGATSTLGRTYIVCNYYPGGNYGGQKPY